MTSGIKFIDEADIRSKRVLLRVDFNVTLLPDLTISDDSRIKQSLQTIKYLLQNKNRLILISHLDRPDGLDSRLSLKPAVERLQNFLPNYKIKLVDDFLTEDGKKQVDNQTENEILVFENIRFYSEEKNNDPDFAQKLANLADVYVNDAFGVSHREQASVVGVPKFIPSYGGFILKKEIQMISKVLRDPQKPFVAIIGGIKLETKLPLVNKFLSLADFILVGSGLVKHVSAREKIILPTDLVEENGEVLDIGPESQKNYADLISKAKTIVWNGPVGFFENPKFRAGTDAVLDAIIKNQQAVSIVGGGDTIEAISKKENLDKITHISTGGGAMLTFIEKGTLPGIEALKK